MSPLKIVGISFLFFLGLGILVFFLQTVGLVALPFVTHQQTMILRASNGYITSHQSELRKLRSAYDAAGDEQKATILAQMHEAADLIPDDIQPDIQRFLQSH